MDMPTLISVLDDHGFGDTSTTRKVAIINDVVWDICSREAWPFLEKSVSLTFDGTNAAPSNWPTDVAQVSGVVDTVNGNTLVPVRIEEVRSTYSNMLTTTGIPYIYYFLANQMFAFPVPAATQTLLMTYLCIPAALTSTSLETAIVIPPRWHGVIWSGALAQLYDEEDDPEEAVKFETRMEKKYQLMRYQAWIRQVDSPDTIKITDYEDLFD